MFIYSTTPQIGTGFALMHVLLFSFLNTQFYPYILYLFYWHWGNHTIAIAPLNQFCRICVNRSHTIWWHYHLHNKGTTKHAHISCDTRNEIGVSFIFRPTSLICVLIYSQVSPNMHLMELSCQQGRRRIGRYTFWFALGTPMLVVKWQSWEVNALKKLIHLRSEFINEGLG